MVTGYWNMFKQNIGIMIAVAQLAATQPRFADVQNEFRRFGIDIVAASVRRAQEQGYGSRPRSRAHRRGDRAAVRELHHRVRRHASGLGVEISDEDADRDAVDDLEEDAVRLLTESQKGDHRGFQPPRTPSGPARRDGRVHRGGDQTAGAREHAVLRPASRVRPHRLGERRHPAAGVGGPARRDAQARRRGRLAALRPAVAVRRPRRHQPRHGRHPGTPGAQGTRAAQRPAGRVVDRRQLPAGHHDGPVRHRRAEARSGPRR